VAGPYRFAALMDDPNLRGMECTARTRYVVTGTNSCLVLMSARSENGRDKTFCAETVDGGRAFRFVSWLVPPSDPYRAVMPAVTDCGGGKLVSALRRRDRPAMQSRAG
jgi:hypothetical protein